MSYGEMWKGIFIPPQIQNPNEEDRAAVIKMNDKKLTADEHR